MALDLAHYDIRVTLVGECTIYFRHGDRRGFGYESHRMSFRQVFERLDPDRYVGNGKKVGTGFPDLPHKVLIPALDKRPLKTGPAGQR